MRSVCERFISASSRADRMPSSDAGLNSGLWRLLSAPERNRQFFDSCSSDAKGRMSVSAVAASVKYPCVAICTI